MTGASGLCRCWGQCQLLSHPSFSHSLFSAPGSAQCLRFRQSAIDPALTANGLANGADNESIDQLQPSRFLRLFFKRKRQISIKQARVKHFVQISGSWVKVPVPARPPVPTAQPPLCRAHVAPGSPVVAEKVGAGVPEGRPWAGVGREEGAHTRRVPTHLPGRLGDSR